MYIQFQKMIKYFSQSINNILNRDRLYHVSTLFIILTTEILRNQLFLKNINPVKYTILQNLRLSESLYHQTAKWKDID